MSTTTNNDLLNQNKTCLWLSTEKKIPLRDKVFVYYYIFHLLIIELHLIQYNPFCKHSDHGVFRASIYCVSEMSYCCCWEAFISVLGK